ncbi:MAG TPA: MATE family efflux transporter [Treponema sp.]|nr:MATE family efflux transporter [Treponema sp.]
MAANKIDMTQGSIFPKLIRFAVPLIFSSILQLLFNAADIIVVGRFAGDNSLAAVGSTSSLVNLLVNFFIGLGIGCNVVAANYLGSMKSEKVSRTVHTSMVLSVFGGILLTFIGVTFSRQILVLMGSPEVVLPLSTLYLKIFFGGVTPTVIYNFGASLLRAKGDTKRPLYILFVAGLINVVLNLIFVICFKMDVAGVAVATVISQSFSAVVIVILLLREKDAFRLEFRKLKIDFHILSKIVRIGIPAGLQGMIFSISNVVIQSSVNSFGPVMIAGNAAAQGVEGFIYISMNGFSQAMLTFAGQNMGAGKIDRIKKAVRDSILCASSAGIILGCLAIVFGPVLLGFYSTSPEVQAAGMIRLKVILLTYFTCGIMDCTANAIRGVGHSVLPMVITLLGACGLRMLYIFTFFQIPRFHTFRGIFYSYPISWTVTAAILAIGFIRILKTISVKDKD